MPDLSTSYLGLKLSSPLVPSASPLSKSLDNLRRIEDAGAGAVVLHSLFEEQILAESHVLDRFLTYGAESYAEALSSMPEAAAPVAMMKAAMTLSISPLKTTIDSLFLTGLPLR